MIRVFVALVLALSCVGTARADDVLQFGAQPGWVAPVAEPAAKPADGAVTLRLLDFQIRFDDRGTHTFTRQIVRVNTPEGLSAAGNIGLVWQPAFGGATVHRVTIHRGTETIDALKDGKGFQILRREAGLESLTITGLLTAVMPVSDLRVGDEIEFAYTIDANNPVLAGHAESTLMLGKLPATDRVSALFSWPAGRAMDWRAGALVPKGALTKAGGWQVLTIARDGWETPDIPAGAPGRFAWGGVVQVSDFGNWAMVAGTMRPLYAKAATIAPDSPVMAEVKRIAALTSDPRARASEALRVVQSQVRYLARIDGLGNYTPESADAVWAGKSGDCKGKTVLLLAMLRALGIDAQPALVSATDGDGIDGSLPAPGRFNHVIVRATIDGKVYWLDGTRLGDGGVDTIAVPGFKWALPLDDAAPALAAILPAEPALPETEYQLELDAREGFDKPAKAVGSVTYRGDTGSQTRVSLTVIPAAQRDELLRKLWTDRYSWLDLDTVTYDVDAKTGDVSIRFTGKAKMDWSTDGLDAARRYEADYSRLGRYLSPDRKKNADAVPVAIDGDYSLNRETILLPDAGKGFTVEGDAIDKVVGGVRYVRTVTLANGRFEMTVSNRNKSFELSYAAAKEADKAVDGLFARQLFIRAPADYEVGAATAAKVVPTVADADPDTPADTSLGEVSRLALAGGNEDALKLLDGRIAGGEKGAAILAMRGELLDRLGRDDEANAAFDQALVADRREPTAILGKARMLVDAGRPEDALILYDRMILLHPESADSYRKRGAIRYALGDRVGAISDAGIVLGKQPDDYWAHDVRATLFLEQGKAAEAEGEARDMVKRKPDNAFSHALLAYVLAASGKRTEALAESDRSLAITPASSTYYTRLQFDLGGDKGRLKDTLALIGLAPADGVPAPTLRRLLAVPAARAAIMAAYDEAVGAKGNDDGAAEQRDLMIAIGGNTDPYITRGDTNLAKKPDDPARLNEACWRRAMFRTDLTKATEQCDKAIAKSPLASILDSRGLVWLQRGDWQKAASDYDAALATRPRLASSLYGRGIARARLGQAAASKADLAAAARIEPDIADIYAGYGLKP